MPVLPKHLSLETTVAVAAPKDSSAPIFLKRQPLETQHGQSRPSKGTLVTLLALVGISLSCAFSLPLMPEVTAPTPAVTERAKPTSETLQQEKTALTLYERAEKLYKVNSTDKAALNLYRQSLAAAGVRDSAIRAKALIGVSAVLTSQGNTTGALPLIKEASGIYARLGDVVGRANSAYNLGFTYKQLGRHDIAMRFYQIAAELSRQANLPGQLGSALNNIGTINLDQGNLSQAQLLYSQALEAFTRANLPECQALALLNLGSVNAMFGNLDGARAHYRQASQTLRQHGLEQQAKKADHHAAEVMARYRKTTLSNTSVTDGSAAKLLFTSRSATGSKLEPLKSLSGH